MSRRIQCRALLLALVLGSAHAASPALHAAPASRRPDPSVDRRLSSTNPLLPLLLHFVDRFLPFGLGEDKGAVTPPPPPTGPGLPPPSNEEGPAIDPNGKPKG